MEVAIERDEMKSGVCKKKTAPQGAWVDVLASLTREKRDRFPV